jgi:hypothetical protein
MGAVFKIYASPVALKRAVTFIGIDYERSQCPICFAHLQNRTPEIRVKTKIKVVPVLN